MSEAEEEHKNHRKRIRRRFREEGLDAFAEHEVVELLLTFSIPRKNTNSLGHNLITRFGSLAGVLAASQAELTQVDGIGEHSAALLTLVPQIWQKVHLLESEPVFGRREQVGAYLLNRYSGEKREMVYLLCLDGRGRLLACPCVREGTLTGTDLDVRQVVRYAVLHAAAAVVLSHNHPSGLAIPSEEDYAATDRIREGLKIVGVTLLDHIIVADGDYVSLRESGYLTDSV